MFFFFFFSSRRRHTRSLRDWSSDVCSSDLTSWSYGQSVGATSYFLADVNGDGKADLVAFYAATGDWYVSLSSGTGFWPPTHWASGQGVGTSKQFLADVDGDGRADLITFDANT